MKIKQNDFLNVRNILLAINGVLCLVVKILSWKANANGPVLILCGIIFYMVFKKHKYAFSLYLLLSFFAVAAMIYSVLILILIFRGYSRYDPLIPISICYILLGTTHCIACVYFGIEKRKEE